MIDAHEIRRGNWLSNGANSFRVTDICDTSVNLEYSEGGGHSWVYDLEDDCFGIELSPELLIAAGFEKNKENYFIYDRFCIDVVNGKFRYCPAYDKPYGKPVEYLHQLQNVYYFLVGKELEIKL